MRTDTDSVPELPEVETIKNDLAAVLVGQKITEVEVRLPKIIKSNRQAFRRQVQGQRIGSLARRGKLLIIELENSDRYLLIHLKMTGQLIYRKGAHLIAGGHSDPASAPAKGLRRARGFEAPNKHTHVIFFLSGGARLFFNDLRQFGYIKAVDAQTKEDELSVYGVEPLAEAFTPALLRDRLKKRRTSLKSVLLDQSVIAGLGNIYVDEACFLAGLKPTRRADRVSIAEAAALHHAIQHIIRLAITHRGTTFNNYRDAHGRTGDFVRRLKVYGRGGEQCLKCRKNILKRVTLAGRGTVYCPVCQR